MFDKKELENQIATSWLGRSFYFYEEIPSTNSHAKKLPKNESLHGVLIVADHQVKGRGQYDRQWETNAGQNLTFSVILEPPNANRLILLTLACALAIEDALEEIAETACIIKWPNDILCNGRKLCGILTETVFSGNVLDRVVVGIGLNVNQTDFAGELSGTAVSLKQTAGAKQDFSREKLLAVILQKMEYRYRMWSQHDSRLVKQINQKLQGYGEWRKLKVDGRILKGKYKFLGVNEIGELMALNEDFDVKKFAYEQIRVL